MSHDSRAREHSHRSDEDRSDYAGGENDRGEERSQDAAADSERVHRRDGAHHAGPHPDPPPKGDGTGHAEHHHSPEHVRDAAKFASYDDEDAASDTEDNRDAERHSHRHKEHAERSYRDERTRRSHGDSYAPQATATRRVTDAAPAGSAAVGSMLNEPIPAIDPLGDPLAYPGSGLHPYDHNRAAMIALSTGLVAAIVIIVVMMSKLSSNGDLAPKIRQEYETKLAGFQQDYQSVHSLAEQRARDLQAAADQAAQNQRLAQQNAQAYQQELQRRQATEQQFQQQGQVRQAENEQHLYVTQVRLAKQAWDRGDTNQVLQLLEPYRSDPARQKLRTFAWYYLWQAAHNGGNSTLRGHADFVRQVAIAPDGSQIVSLADDSQMIFWDAASGRKLSSMNLERNVPPRSAGVVVEDQLARRAGGLVMAANGAWAAAYGRDLFVGTNIRQPDAVRPVSDHTSPIISLAMSSDGRRLVSGDYSGEIVVRDAADGSVLRRFHIARPLSLALSADGGLLFAGMHDGALYVWDANKGDLLGSRAFGDGINSMALSPDGSVVAMAMAVRDGVVRLWEPATGRFRGDLRGHHDEVTHVTWSRDGRSLLTASRDQTACLWSNNGALLRTFRGHLGDVEAAAFSPDGQRVVSAGDDQSVILWNVDGGQPCDMLADTPVDGWVSGLAFSPDASQVIGTGSCEGAGDSFEAYLTDWNLADGNRPLPLQTSSRSGVALAFSPDGRQMVVGESSPPESTVKSRVRIWSLDPPRVLGTVPKLPGSVYSVAYSPDGRMLAVGTGDVEERSPGTVLLVEPATGALRQKLPDMPGKVEAMFTVDSRYLITVNSSRKRPAEIRIWNPATAQLALQIDNVAELAGLTTIALRPTAATW